MRLQEVPVVEVHNVDRFYEDTPEGRVWHNEERTHRFYDFGPDDRGHEGHVQMRVEDFSCGQHETFTDDCEACNTAVFGPPDEPERGIAIHLRKSRGIELVR